VFFLHTVYIACRFDCTGLYKEMTRSPASLLIALFLIAAPVCLAQTRIAISYPDLEQEKQVVHISYRIGHSNASDRFLVEALTPTRRELLPLRKPGAKGKFRPNWRSRI
jgi:hypothetical protein